MAAEIGSILSTAPRRVHFIGVGGSGMYPLVQILLAAGHHISGSDVNEGDILGYERRAGVRVDMGHRAENVRGADLVVYSAAIGEGNPERQQAVRLGIPCVERSVLLGYVTTLYRRPLCIAGTHGKTTATGMAVQILQMAGLAPGAVIGGRLPLIGGYGQAGALAEGWLGREAGKQPEPEREMAMSSRPEGPNSAAAECSDASRGPEGVPRDGAPAGRAAAGGALAEGWLGREAGKPTSKGDGIVVEADEYHNTFLELAVDTAVVLNVDADHLEFFGSMENLKKSFRTFCTHATGAVLYNGDDANSREVTGDLAVPAISFGFGAGCALRAADAREHRPAYWAFTAVQNGEELGRIELQAPGRHNIYNALAACGGAMRLGAGFAQCAQGLAAFRGTGRRFDVQGTVNGFTVADDYAHHPAELRAVLTTAKQMGYRQVWAVFQPYTYSRTQMLLDDFAEVLPIADHVVMTAIMGGREQPGGYTVTTADLAAKIPGSVWFETQREAADYILQNARPGDLVLTLGCGDIYKCAHMLMEHGEKA